MEKGLIAFIVFFLVFVYGAMFNKWKTVFISIPGMFISVVVIAYYSLGGQ